LFTDASETGMARRLYLFFYRVTPAIKINLHILKLFYLFKFNNLNEFNAIPSFFS